MRAFMEARYLELGLGPRHGFVTDLARRSGVLRGTLSSWLSRSATPRLDALGAVANVLKVTRAELVAARDGTTVAPQPGRDAELVTDAVRRRRRAWWLGVARQTAGLDLGPARDALAALGFRSEKGNLISIWEDPTNRTEPDDARLRALAEIYRIPFSELVDLWNNPPPTDEEAIAARRVVPITEVLDGTRSRPATERRRKRAS